MLNINEEILKKIEYKNVLVALSGGVDSVVMFELLNSYKNEYNFNIEIAHFNHITRNGQSDIDEKFVRKIASENDIIIHVGKKSMDIYSKDNNISAEDAGRILRHNFFNEIINSKVDNENWFLALAHNLDDQVETILMRIIRGTGIDGLKGMGDIEDNIIRPILHIPKKDIIEYAETNSIKYVQDETNFENDYTRNSIRNELIPLIKKKYNPNFNEAILSLSEISNKHNLFLKENISSIIEELVISREYDKTDFDKTKILQLDEFIQIEILRMEIDRIHSNYNFTKMQYKEIVKIINSSRGVDLQLNGLVFYNSFDRFVIRKINNFEFFDEVSMKIKRGKFEFGNYFLVIEDSTNYDSGIFLDYGDVITVRRRKNGDKIIKNEKEIKLKDYLIDKKIDKIDRDIFPIIEYNNKILLIENIYKYNIGYKAEANIRFIPKLRSKNEQ